MNSVATRVFSLCENGRPPSRGATSAAADHLVPKSNPIRQGHRRGRRGPACHLVNGCRHTYTYAMPTPTPKVRYGFWITPSQRDGLRLVKERDGVPESEQIRRAIDAWLKSRGVRTPKKGGA